MRGGIWKSFWRYERRDLDRATPVRCAVETTTNPAEDYRAFYGFFLDPIFALSVFFFAFVPWLA